MAVAQSSLLVLESELMASVFARPPPGHSPGLWRREYRLESLS